MKIFDKDGDGDFDLKDVLIMCTLAGTVFNLILNMFSLLNVGVAFTVSDNNVLNCGVVTVDGQKTMKCITPQQQVKLAPEVVDVEPR